MRRRRLTCVMSMLAFIAGRFVGTTSPAAAQSGSDDCRSPLASATEKTPQQRADDWASEASEALAKAGFGGTDVITFKELCTGPYDALLPKPCDYAGHFAGRKTCSGCGAWGPDTTIGQAILFRGAAPEQVSGSSVVVEVAPAEPRLAVCATGPLSERHTLACNVHLSQQTVAGGMHELPARIKAQAGGASVIVTGDFNRRPADINPTLAAGVTADGPLAEADRALDRPTTRWDSRKIPAGRTKSFEHTFFSTEDVRSLVAKIEDPQLSEVKDQALLRAFAVPCKPVRRNLTGDGREDVLARIGTELYVYPDPGVTTLSAARRPSPTGRAVEAERSPGLSATSPAARTSWSRVRRGSESARRRQWRRAGRPVVHHSERRPVPAGRRPVPSAGRSSRWSLAVAGGSGGRGCPEPLADKPESPPTRA
ncbi:hypothetical protein ACFVRB_36605 [Streptomyces nojiriensis]|uniref:hypothetical protein n=1 Tax=Streptomyces nojiriensis TaxID=66374 RepID=UPI0036DE2C1C